MVLSFQCALSRPGEALRCPAFVALGEMVFLRGFYGGKDCIDEYKAVQGFIGTCGGCMIYGYLDPGVCVDSNGKGNGQLNGNCDDVAASVNRVSESAST